jgi:hypothetical protein
LATIERGRSLTRITAIWSGGAADDRCRGSLPLFRPGWRRRFGVAVLGLAAATMTSGTAPAESRPNSTSHLETERATLVGLRRVASEQMSYEPGASRTWSPSPQIIGVKVLSGRVTVYGSDDERQVYLAGEGYVAGWAPYRSVNETDERVETLITNHVRP